MNIKFEAIDKACWENNPSMLKDYGFEKDNDDYGYSIADYHFGCTSPKVRSKLAKLGWYVDKENEKVLVYNINTLNQVRELSEKIQEAYEANYFIPLWKYWLFYPYYALIYNCRWKQEGSAFVAPKWADRFWYDEMGLGSDCDVDYNGTYLDIAFDMIEVAHKNR